MEKISNGEDKIRRAEEIYYRRKFGNSSPKYTKFDGEKKSYFVSKIILDILLIVNLSIAIISIQNKDYIFTENFLKDVEGYNINISKSIKNFLGVETEELQEENVIQENNTNSQVEEAQNSVEITNTEGIVPNNDVSSTSENLTNNDNAMSLLTDSNEKINKIQELVEFRLPIKDGIVTSRFGNRESSKKNVEGYHTGIDIGAKKRYIYIFCNITEQ